MREFKFRAWDKDKMLYSDLENRELEYERVSLFYQGIDQSEIVMQFTGLSDKNGYDIYEGDIVQDAEVAYEVTFGEAITGDCESWGFRLSGESGHGPLSKSDCPYLEIIGTRYENPELLKRVYGDQQPT